MARSTLSLWMVLGAGLLAAVGALPAAEVAPSTIDNGGATSAGGTFEVTGSIGQPDAGEMSGGSLVLSGGFWTSTHPFVLPKADLSITKTDAPDPVRAGNSVTYSLGVANAGPNDASNVRVLDLLADETTFDGPSSDPSCTQPVNLEGLRAMLDGPQVVPPSASGATGIATLILDTSTSELHFSLHVQSFVNPITSATLRLGAGDVLVKTLYAGAPPTFEEANPISGTISLSAPELAALMASGSHYVDVRTAVFPGGEIRGAVVAAATAPVECDLGTVTASGDGNADVVAAVSSSTADGAVLENVAIVVSTTTDPNAVALPSGELAGDTAHASTTVNTEADLEITKVDSADPAVSGTALTYTITVTNNGPSDALGVQASDTLPAGLSGVSTAGDCSESSPAVPTCTLGTIAAGAFKQYTISATIGSGLTGMITNTAAVTSSTTLVNPGDDSVDETTTATTEANLVITKTDSPDPVAAGNNLDYLVTVQNLGPSDALDVQVTDTLPAGVTASSTVGACSEPSPAVPTCSIGTIVAGSSNQYTITVAVNPGTTSVITNNASVSSSTLLVSPGDDSVKETTTVNAEADLSVTKTDGRTTAVPGESLTYTIVVTNNGPSTDPAAIFTDTFPAELTCTFTSIPMGGATGQTTAGGGNLSETLAMPPGSSVEYRVDCSIASNAAGTLSNTATVTSSVTDLVPGNDSATDNDTVLVPEADLSIGKTDSMDPLPPSSPLDYTITVTNGGPSDAVDVLVSETLPAGVTFVSTSGCLNDPSGMPVCDLGGLVAGDSIQYTVSVTTDPTTDGLITNTVTVASDTTDSTPGNDTTTEDTLVDDMPPTVAQVDSLSSFLGAQITECDEVKTSVRRLDVQFSEPVRDPVGDSDPDDVTNPANYRLVAAGADRDLTTLTCGALLGDDQLIGLAGVTYAGQAATLTLDAELSDSLYRLLVCGSTSIRDPAGNALDGDGDGVGGDDFLLTFRVDRTNRFENGQVDCSLVSWNLASVDPAEIEHSSEDVDDAVASGSIHVFDLSGTSLS